MIVTIEAENVRINIIGLALIHWFVLNHAKMLEAPKGRLSA